MNYLKFNFSNGEKISSTSLNYKLLVNKGVLFTFVLFNFYLLLSIKNKAKLPFFAAFVIILLLGSCAADISPNLGVKPPAMGITNEIVVICDQDVWDDYVGDSLRYYFSSAFPILPQPESVFDLKHYTPEALIAQPIRKELRTYLILADLSNNMSSTSNLLRQDLGSTKVQEIKTGNQLRSVVGRDKWAKGQLLIYLFGFSRDELVKTVREAYPAAAKRVNAFDEIQIDQTVYQKGENQKLKKEIKEAIGVDIKVPGDYQKAIHDENVIWIRKDHDDMISNIMLHKLKYSSQKQLSKEGLKAIRDSLGKQYISTDLKDTYMRTNDVDLPMFTKSINLNNYYALEARGIWDIENDFMGGPFISYLVHNPNSNELLYIDGFVYAPGKQKRNHIQYLEHIFSSVKF